MKELVNFEALGDQPLKHRQLQAETWVFEAQLLANRGDQSACFFIELYHEYLAAYSEMADLFEQLQEAGEPRVEPMDDKRHQAAFSALVGLCANQWKPGASLEGLVSEARAIGAEYAKQELVAAESR